MPAKKVDRLFNLWVLLQQTTDAVYNARNKELSKYSISAREAATLRAITSIGKTATPSQVARWAYRKPHTIAGILNRMQKKGLITLTKDTNIRSLVRISLTDEGKRVYKDARKRQSIHRIFKFVDDEMCNQLESYLTRIRDGALQDTGDTIHRAFP